MKINSVAAALLATFLVNAPFHIATAATSDRSPVRISDQLEQQIIEWRRDIHQNPELSNREFRTAALVAEHLNSLLVWKYTLKSHTPAL